MMSLGSPPPPHLDNAIAYNRTRCRFLPRSNLASANLLALTLLIGHCTGKDSIAGLLKVPIMIKLKPNYFTPMN